MPQTIRDTRNVEGAALLSRGLVALGNAAGGKALRAAATSAMLPTLRKAQATAPVGSVPHKTYKGRLVAPGFLKRSIRRVSKLSRDKQKVTVRLGVRNEAFYGVAFLEIGTSKMTARPWLVPAYNATYREVTQRLAAQLERNIKRAAAKVRR